MTYSAQNFVLFDAMSGEGDGLAQTTVAQHQPYFLGAPVLGGGMYGVNPLMVEAPVSATIAAASTGGALGPEGRRRSPTHGRTNSAADHAQRRATHNAIERARRESLNGQFQDLASAVPALIHVRRPSKATIVEKSLDYIRTFKGHLGNRDGYIKKLQMRNLALHDEVNRLRNQLGLEPLSEASEPASEEEAGEDDAAKAAESPQEAPLVSAPQQEQPQQKRRQQSLDLGRQQSIMDLGRQQSIMDLGRQQSEDLGRAGEHTGAGRPALRVLTGAQAGPHSSDGHASSVSAASSQSSPLMRGSPLSAPLLSQMPQLPSMDVDVSAQVSQQQFAAAVFAAGQGLQTMPAMPAMAQFSAMSMGMGLTSPLPVTSMAGFVPQAGIDMSKLSEVFASAASMPPAPAVMSLATDIEFSAITQ